MRKKLPKLNRARTIGVTSEELLMSVLGKYSNVIPIPTDKDLGIDMRCEVLNHYQPTGIHYNIQCKGTEDTHSKKEYFSIPIEITTINYWLQQREPTFLVVVDRINQYFYWAYPLYQIKERINALQSQQTVNIRVPKANIFTDEITMLPVNMYNIMYEYHYNILEKIVESLKLKLMDVGERENKGTLQQYISVSSSIEDLLKNINLIEDLNKNLLNKITQIIDEELGSYKESVVALDHIPEIRRYIKADFVMDDYGFIKDKTPNMVLTEVEVAWKRFLDNNYRNVDLVSLNKSAEVLYELNRNLAFFLREMLYEINPDEDHEYIIEKYSE
ncbi:DUF4365 domain-containing protein [Bacillus sp. Marseille-Q1617]|uniref:DUF4365 domain-containing protein n=1 Tax=Bacillus sp. Marseille-Q1617 TaxID=2736887 RepID=UPI001589099F|nr:DUF4365 domain-containing protein [Bacillus sp. Marseille-Q1617]